MMSHFIAMSVVVMLVSVGTGGPNGNSMMGTVNGSRTLSPPFGRETADDRPFDLLLLFWRQLVGKALLLDGDDRATLGITEDHDVVVRTEVGDSGLQHAVEVVDTFQYRVHPRLT
jgi:hypothetical protein